MKEIYRGDIFYIEPYNQTEGSEQRAGRPAIVVSNDMCNNYSPVVEVVYLTTQPKNDLPTHVVIRSSTRESTALCEQVTSVSKDRIGDRIASLTDDELLRVNIALMVSLALEAGEPVKLPEPDTAAAKEIAKLRAELDAAEKRIEELTAAARAGDAWREKALQNAGAQAPVQNPTPTPANVAAAAERAKLTAERDTYKALYEGLLGRVLPAACTVGGVAL